MKQGHACTLRSGEGVRPGTAVDWEAGLLGSLAALSKAVMLWMREFSLATVMISCPSCAYRVSLMP